MITEQRKEAAKLAATLINTIAAAYLLSGLVAPFLPGAATANITDVWLRIATGFVVHMLAQAVLYLGLRAPKPHKEKSHEPDNSDDNNRLSLSDGDHSNTDGLSGAGQTGQRESEKPEELDR
jgi:hypothetical protein